MEKKIAEVKYDLLNQLKEYWFLILAFFSFLSLNLIYLAFKEFNINIFQYLELKEVIFLIVTLYSDGSLLIIIFSSVILLSGIKEVERGKLIDSFLFRKNILSSIYLYLFLLTGSILIGKLVDFSILPFDSSIIYAQKLGVFLLFFIALFFWVVWQEIRLSLFIIIINFFFIGTIAMKRNINDNFSKKGTFNFKNIKEIKVDYTKNLLLKTNGYFIFYDKSDSTTTILPSSDFISSCLK
jgi:hypothetical protein